MKNKLKTITKFCKWVALFVFHLLRFCFLSTVTLLGLYALIVYLISGWEFDSTLTALFLLYIIFLSLLNTAIGLLIYLLNISKAIFEKYWMAVAEPIILMCIVIIVSMIASLFINESTGTTMSIILVLAPSYITTIVLLWLWEQMEKSKFQKIKVK